MNIASSSKRGNERPLGPRFGNESRADGTSICHDGIRRPIRPRCHRMDHSPRRISPRIPRMYREVVHPRVFRSA